MISKDHWCGETSLAVSYSELFRVCRDKEVSVADLMKLGNGVLFWDEIGRASCRERV